MYSVQLRHVAPAVRVLTCLLIQMNSEGSTRSLRLPHDNVIKAGPRAPGRGASRARHTLTALVFSGVTLGQCLRPHHVQLRAGWFRQTPSSFHDTFLALFLPALVDAGTVSVRPVASASGSAAAGSPCHIMRMPAIEMSAQPMACV